MLKLPYYCVKSVTSFAIKTCVNLKNVGWTILSLLVLFSKIRPKPIIDSLSHLGKYNCLYVVVQSPVFVHWVATLIIDLFSLYVLFS